MNSIQIAQEAVAKARQELRAAEHEEICALNVRDAKSHALASTVGIKEHVRLKKELEEALSRCEVAHRVYEIAKRKGEHAEENLRRIRHEDLQRKSMLTQTLPIELKLCEGRVSEAETQLATARNDLSAAQRTLALAQAKKEARREQDAHDRIRQATEQIKKAESRLAHEREVLALKQTYFENLSAANAA